MDAMFAFASSFNQSLNNWNVSNVRTMNWMFHDAISFNQPLHAPRDVKESSFTRDNPKIY